MRFVSTEGRTPPADLRTAVLGGLAPDGGLYLPERIEPLARGELLALRGRSLPEIALALAPRLLGPAVTGDALREIVRGALDFPTPLVRLRTNAGMGPTFVLELFHGPSFAFKDVGVRFMAHLITALREPAAEPLTLLTATSGDTGGAVAQAFRRIPGARAVILFPDGQVPELQRRLFTTAGPNVIAAAVEGTFDDCQRLVQEALRRAPPGRLTTANSINVGRLLPQVFYYVYAWAHLPEAGGPLVVSVPSGNFGNLTAGVVAKRLGVPVAMFVAATNVNDAVPVYLETGRFAPRPAVPTISSAMDVGNPSNFRRLLALYEGDRARMRAEIAGTSHTDEAARAAIAALFAREGYVMEPHTAVACLGLETATRSIGRRTGVALATAHPAKLREIVEPIIGAPVPLPAALAALRDAEERIVRIAPRYEALAEILA